LENRRNLEKRKIHPQMTQIAWIDFENLRNRRNLRIASNHCKETL